MLESERNGQATHYYNTALDTMLVMYKRLLDLGVAKEQARVILPLSQYTEVYWTASFQAIVNFIELRDEKTSQWEIQEYAKVMKELMYEVYPKTTEIWSKLYWK